jgi:hypothetical protein
MRFDFMYRMPAYKNVFHTTTQLRKHAEYWHVRSPAMTNYRSAMVNSRTTPEPQDSLDTDVSFALDDTLASVKGDRFCFGGRGMSQFAEWCVVGSVTQAITCLVQESLFQGPVSLDLNIESKLPPHSVQLFLQISKLLLTTTEKQHTVLANVLQVLIDLIPPDLREWPTMPSTMAGFKAHVINPTNKHSLVSILPGAHAYMLSDRSHAYCCLQEIAAFILLVPRTMGVAPIPLRLH